MSGPFPLPSGEHLAHDISANQLVVPSLIFSIKKNPQEAETQKQAGYPFSDPFSNQHDPKPGGAAVFTYNAHPEKFLARRGSLGKKNQRPPHVGNEQSKNQHPPPSLRRNR